jgi:lipopolysaccharide assembly outer membrane protein LptD (OstA)
MACVPLICAAAPKVDFPKDIPDEPIDITAMRIEFTNETLIASGGVTGRFENAVVTADRVSGNTETGDLRIDGNIHFERENVIWDGSELDFNYKTMTGDFGPSSLDFDPVLMSVERVERVSTNIYHLSGATFTTCGKDHPHYRLRAKEAYLVDEEYLTAKGVTVYLGSVPVFYWPYWRHKLQKSIFSYEFGYGSEWGVYALINATVPLTQHIDSSTDLNLYSKRGVGVGQAFSWEYPEAVGQFAAFYLKDEDPYAKFSETSDVGSEIGDDRYRLKFEHLQRFTDQFYLNTKFNYSSDPALIEEFFKDEYRSYAQPENYASLAYGNSYLGTEALANQRLNDFYDNTDRWEYSLDVYRTKIPRTPFYFQSENSIAALDRVVSVIDTTGAAAYDAVRLDSANTVYMPQRYGFLSLVPRAGYRATYYSDTATGGDGMRNIPSAGVQASVQASKILSDRERWYGKGLRHKIEPYVDYIYQNSSIATNELYQFDDIDYLQDENKVKLGLRNVLQTKRNNKLSRFIDLDLYTYYLIEDHGSGNDFDSLYVDVRAPLTKRWLVDAVGTWDWNGGSVPFFDTRLSYSRDDDLTIRLEHLYQAGQRSLWTPRIELYPEGKYSLEAYARYDDRQSDLEEAAVIGYMNWCCMRYGLGYHVYDDDEMRIMFSFGLSAFPKARVSSSF